MVAPAPAEARRTGYAPRLFKLLSATTFFVGACIHTGRVIVGRERWVQEYFTPPVDIAFGALILGATIPGVISWRRYTGGRGLRFAYAFAMLMLLVSIPLHLKTLFTWSTDYLIVFPVWYSLVEIPMFLLLAYAMTRLQFDGAKR